MDIMKQASDLKRNTIIYIIRNVMNVIFPLITFKYASMTILASGIGAAGFVSALVGYFGLIAQLGINTYAIARGAKIRENKKKLSTFASEVFTLNIVTTTIAYMCLFLFLLISDKAYHYRTIIIIYSATILCTTLGMEWIFIIREDFGLITKRSILVQILSLLLLFVLVKDENDVAQYVLITAFASTGSCIWNVFTIRKFIEIKLVGFGDFNKHVKSILIIWISNVASLIYVNADIILVGYMLGDNQVGYYSAAVKIVKAVCIPISAICTVSAPQIAKNILVDKQRTNSLVKQVVEFMSFFMFPCMIGLFLLGDTAIIIISGEEFLSGLTAERILIIDIFLSPINGFLTGQLMIPSGNEKATMKIMTFAAISNIVLDTFLISKIGIVGAAIATVVSETIVFLFLWRYIVRFVDITNVIRDIWKYILASLVIIPIFVITEKICSSYILKTFVVVSASTMSYFICVLLLTGRGKKVIDCFVKKT